MANNLFISYDLVQPGQKYEAVIAEIQKLGNWAKVHYSLWYVSSPHSASEAAERVWAVMDANDKLIVINSTTNDAYWYNLGDEVSRYIQNNWQG